MKTVALILPYSPAEPQSHFPYPQMASAKPGCPGNFPGYPPPVSYTHLDVYKRQEVRCRFIKNNDRGILQHSSGNGNSLTFTA